MRRNRPSPPTPSNPVILPSRPSLAWDPEAGNNTTRKAAATVVLLALWFVFLAWCVADGAPSPPEAPEVAAGSSAAASGAVATNGPVASIAAELRALQARIEASAAAMSNAVASTPAQQADKVRALADEISLLATNDLGDQGKIITEAQRLIDRFNESVAKARRAASDPNLAPSAREIYAGLLTGLEAELGKLMDAKAASIRIRGELLRQAEGLRQSADAIGFAEHCNQLVLASQAFRATLSEVAKFTERIARLIQAVGRIAGIPLT